MIELLVVALVLLIAAACLVAVRRPRQLPGDDWYRGPGAAFAAEETRRRERDAAAREDAHRLIAVIVAETASLDRDWVEPGRGIAEKVLARSESVTTDLLLRLDARERGAGDYTVVLYGRTKAGKSSLFAALTGLGFDGVGDGRQNFTRDSHSAHLGSVHVIDTPGVDGVGSGPLEVLTAAAVHEADLLVFLASDNAVFAEDFERLASLGASACPVIVALNVKTSNLHRLTSEPSKVFRCRRLEPHVRRLRSGLPEHIRDQTDIIAYHALGAECARRGRRKDGRAPQGTGVEAQAVGGECPDLHRRQGRRALWDASRITEVIEAIQAGEDRARRFALMSADEAIVGACDGALEGCIDAMDELDARTHGLDKSIAEVEGILRESGTRQRLGTEIVGAHFASAEQELLAALDVDDPFTFRSRADTVLNIRALNARLKEALDETAELLQEKFDEFRADVRLASRASATRHGLDDLHSHLVQERAARVAAEQRARRRDWSRRGATVVASVAVLLAAETVIGGVVVGLVADNAIDALFPEVDVPADDPQHRNAFVKKVIERASREATAAFERALQEQILTPASSQLLDPLRRQLAELGELRSAIDHLASSIREIRDVAAERRMTQPKEELAAT